MLLQIEIGAVGQAIQFTSSEWEVVHDIYRPLRIVRQFFLRVLRMVTFLFVQTDQLTPLVHILEPLLKHFLPSLCPNKIFNFHLFELEQAENKIPRSDFIAEGFPNLGYPER